MGGRVGVVKPRGGEFVAWEQLAVEFSLFGLRDSALHHVSIGKPFNGVDMDGPMFSFVLTPRRQAVPLVIGTFLSGHQGRLSLRIESVCASEGAFVIPVSPEPRLAVTQGASNLPPSPHTHPGK